MLRVIPVLFMLFLSSCTRVMEGDSWFALGTRFAVRAVPVAGRDITADLARIRGLVADLERRYDPGRDSSETARFNRHGFVPKRDRLYPVLRRGLHLARMTEGAFDPFILPLSRLWGFSSPRPRTRPPSPGSVRRALSMSGYRRIRVDGDGIRMPVGGGFDGGGYVKGFIADRIRDRLREWGYRQAIVDAGGDIALIGRRPASYGPENGWIVMIAHPEDRGRNWCSLVIRDNAVVTSGDYERFFEWRGKRYHHILDPVTGYPARRAVSVTVVGPSVETADALATAFFVAGYRRASRLLTRFSGYGFMMLVRRGARLQAFFSPGFRERWRYSRLP